MANLFWHSCYSGGIANKMQVILSYKESGGDRTLCRLWRRHRCFSMASLRISQRLAFLPAAQYREEVHLGNCIIGREKSASHSPHDVVSSMAGA